jgi:hypothetical protein
MVGVVAVGAVASSLLIRRLRVFIAIACTSGYFHVMKTLIELGIRRCCGQCCAGVALHVCRSVGTEVALQCLHLMSAEKIWEISSPQ